MISQPDSLLNQSLPPLRTLFPNHIFKPVPGQCHFVPLKPSRSQDLPVPCQSSSVARATGRRASTTSNSSTPPLSFSPSPSPRLPPSAEFRLVPCSLNQADVVITRFNGSSTKILTGLAMQRAIKADRRVHPYRIAQKTEASSKHGRTHGI